ncbi:MAG TPA: four helix bundle protein [Vicinamibacterales bacterium]|jgi:four helix bundle protein|nr:four helix bundle protein [Vicinamibacterales bacterium]
MSRDHRKLRVFRDAYALTKALYKHTIKFPREEWYGIRQQIRRAAVSVPTNIVEGSARKTTKDSCNFLNPALASACEVPYLVVLASELGFLDASGLTVLKPASQAVVRQLQRLSTEMEAILLEELAAQSRLKSEARRPTP